MEFGADWAPGAAGGWGALPERGALRERAGVRQGVGQDEARHGWGRTEDDPNIKLAVENLRLMKEDQRSWIEPPGAILTEAATDEEEDGLCLTGGASATTEANQKIGSQLLLM